MDEEAVVDEVVSVLELADIAKSLTLPPATGEKGKGPRTRLREALEKALEDGDQGLDLRGVSHQEIHDADVAYLARVAYVSAYLRQIDLFLQPAGSYAKRLAVAKIAQANINNAESTKLSVLQLGKNSATDEKLRDQIKKLRASNRTLAERRVVMLHDEKDTEAAFQEAEDSEAGES